MAATWRLLFDWSLIAAQKLRKFVKLLHTLGSCGLIGSLIGYCVVIIAAHDGGSIAVGVSFNILSKYVLLPSLAVVLITGLLAMVVHRPFQEMRWVWLKAFLGLSVFEASLGVLAYASELSHQIANLSALRLNWYGACALLALCVVNIVLAIWRPRLNF
jgi:hypothetical protein